MPPSLITRITQSPVLVGMFLVSSLTVLSHNNNFLAASFTTTPAFTLHKHTHQLKRRNHNHSNNNSDRAQNQAQCVLFSSNNNNNNNNNNNDDEEDVWSDDAIDFNSLTGGDEIMETIEDTRDDNWNANADSNWGGAINEDGTTSYESSFADDDEDEASSTTKITPIEILSEDDGEAWLDQLAQITADEIEFIDTETERADMQRQMMERGFSSGAIEATLGLATDDALEREIFDNEALDGLVDDDMSMDLEDLKTVESHSRVELDEETNEPIRTQMVYVDEHTCIGCTNCAQVAQSTFFMEDDLGRARVFQQWGDDEETIQVAIETCPVDCIHYVPYEELKRLEIDRRGQNINFKARLVNQGEYGGGTSHNVGGGVQFTAPQQISGNMGTRCNNCPSRGCKNCPMYGIGKNPEFERREKERKRKREERKLRMEMEKREKRSEL